MFFFLVACTADRKPPEPSKPQHQLSTPPQERPAQTKPAMANHNLSSQSKERIRFIALGDGGEGNPAQYANAQAIKKVCEQKKDQQAGCDFAIYLGDNFYDNGVDDIQDEQFINKFELPYKDLDFPFYVALGNHDYGTCIFGKCGLGLHQQRTRPQIEYSYRSYKWNMPAAYYSFQKKHVQFFALDTNAILWDPWFSTATQQRNWIHQARGNSTATWNIAFGHHPYISNGRHGNAGSYEGLTWLPTSTTKNVILGAAVQDFMQHHICGQMDVYLSGHDHNRQWLAPTCGSEFIVSGAAAKTSNLVGRGTASLFSDDQSEGFLWVEITNNCLLGEFYNRYGKMEFSRHICK